MQIEHIVWEDGPHTKEQALAIGSALWEINIRSHGDYADNYVLVAGRFHYFGKHSNGVIKFFAEGLDNGHHDIEPYQIRRYGKIVG